MIEISHQLSITEIPISLYITKKNIQINSLNISLTPYETFSSSSVPLKYLNGVKKANVYAHGKFYHIF